MSLDERAKALLSNDSLPMVAIPRARTHHQRNFRLPTCVRPKSRATSGKRPPGEQREHGGAPAFGDRTTTWLRQGDDFEIELGELEYDDPPRNIRVPLVIGTGAVALIALVWLIAV